jgi:hypothetical protein
MIRSVTLVMVVSVFAISTLLPHAVAQPKGAKVAKQAAAPAKGRLPAHYAKLVDDGQRERIYRIQAGYQAKIDALEAELQALAGKRDAEIRAVLTPEQLRRLDALIAEAQASRTTKAAIKAEAKKAEAAGPKVPRR